MFMYMSKMSYFYVEKNNIYVYIYREREREIRSAKINEKDIILELSVQLTLSKNSICTRTNIVD
jgi:hypothetical protein